MTVLHRTDLTTSQKIECAATAVAGQHEHGSKTALSETYEISRPTVYAVGATAEAVLRTHFEAPLLGGAAVTVRVDDAQLRRAVVALRVLAPNAIRPIEDLLPVLYPGVKVSYGTIQQMLVDAECRAARFNAQSSLDGVQAGALDEMFSQGEPVLAGVDLDTGYLFGLSLSATRDAGAWAQVLRRASVHHRHRLPTRAGAPAAPARERRDCELDHASPDPGRPATRDRHLPPCRRANAARTQSDPRRSTSAGDLRCLGRRLRSGRDPQEHRVEDRWRALVVPLARFRQRNCLM